MVFLYEHNSLGKKKNNQIKQVQNIMRKDISKSWRLKLIFLNYCFCGIVYTDLFFFNYIFTCFLIHLCICSFISYFIISKVKPLSDTCKFRGPPPPTIWRQYCHQLLRMLKSSYLYPHTCQQNNFMRFHLIKFEALYQTSAKWLYNYL